MNTNNEKYARRFIKAIQKLTSPDYQQSLENFENYLKEHFADWLEGYCDTPEHITNEIEWFVKECNNETMPLLQEENL